MRFGLYLSSVVWASAGTFTITPVDIPRQVDQRILGVAQLDRGTPARPDLILFTPATAQIPGTVIVSWDYQPHDPLTAAETQVGRVPAYIAYQIVDADDDPLPDIVFIHSDREEILRGGKPGFISVLFNRGGRRFEWKRVAGLPFVPNHFAVADFDRDGKPDVLVGGASARGALLPGKGGGEFDDPVATINIPDKVTGIHASDLNADGFPDLVYVGTAGITITTGGQNRISTPFNPSNVYTRAASADVNRDGRMDVLVLARDGPHVLLNQPAGFRPPAKLASLSRPSEMVVADVDGDGLEDLLIADGAADRSGLNDSFLQVLSSLGNGTFTPAAIFPAGPSFVVYDADRDGMMDIVATTDSRAQPWGQLMRGSKAAARSAVALVGTPPTAYQVSVQGERPSFGALTGTVRVTITIDGRERPPVLLTIGANGAARADFDFGRSKVELRAEYLGNANYLPTAASVSADFTPPPPPPAAVTVSSAFAPTSGDAAPDSRIVITGTNLAAESAVADDLAAVLAGLRGSVRDSSGAEFPLLFDSVSPGRADAYLPAGVALGSASIRLTSSSSASIFEGLMNVKAVVPTIANTGGFAIGAASVVSPDGTEEPVTLIGPDGPLALDLRPGGSARLVLTCTGIRAGTAFEVTAGSAQAADVVVGPTDRAGLDQISFTVPEALAGNGETAVRIAADGVVANEVKVVFRQ